MNNHYLYDYLLADSYSLYCEGGAKYRAADGSWHSVGERVLKGFTFESGFTEAAAELAYGEMLFEAQKIAGRPDKSNYQCDGITIENKPKALNPPLHTAHSRMIIHPGCLVANENYVTCAKHSRESSGFFTACEPQPQICQTSAWLD